MGEVSNTRDGGDEGRGEDVEGNADFSELRGRDVRSLLTVVLKFADGTKDLPMDERIAMGEPVVEALDYVASRLVQRHPGRFSTRRAGDCEDCRGKGLVSVGVGQDTCDACEEILQEELDELLLSWRDRGYPDRLTRLMLLREVTGSLLEEPLIEDLDEDEPEEPES